MPDQEKPGVTINISTGAAVAVAAAVVLVAGIVAWSMSGGEHKPGVRGVLPHEPESNPALRKQAKIQVGSLEKSLGLYYLDNSSYPTTEQGLRVLIEPASGQEKPYLDSEVVPDDPWGHEFRYRHPGSKNPERFDLWSIGPDGKDGTSDDIGNW